VTAAVINVRETSQKVNETR